MKTIKFFLLTFVSIYFSLHLSAQVDTSSSSDLNSTDAKNFPVSQPMNFIKINLTGIVVKNYSLQYERVLNKTISVAVSFRAMPTTGVPFKSTILKQVSNEDLETKEVIDNLKISDFAFTPEIRFYLSKKGYGQGIYLAPFYRHASFKTNNFTFNYAGTSTEGVINLPGKFTTNTGGLLLGYQQTLGKHFCIDWWILGPHFGAGNGVFTGTSPQPLSQQDQDDLKQQLENLDVPFTKETVTVTANNASLKLSGAWGGLRSGITFGVRF